MTATATWSSQGLAPDRVAEACLAKAPDLNVAWALSAVEHERLDVSVRYRKVDKLTIGELRAGRLAGRRPRSRRPEAPLVCLLMNLSGRLSCRYSGGEEFIVEPVQL